MRDTLRKMRRFLALAALAVAALLAGAAPAAAYQPDAQPVSEQWLLDVAATARTVMPPPCEPNLLTAPLDTGVIARAEMPDEPLFACRVYFHRDTIAHYTALLRTGDRAQKRSVLSYVCAVAAHEFGHLRGLEHTHDGGLMDEAVIATPIECTTWAFTVVPRKARTAKKHRRTKLHLHIKQATGRVIP